MKKKNTNPISMGKKVSMTMLQARFVGWKVDAILDT